MALPLGQFARQHGVFRVLPTGGGIGDGGGEPGPRQLRGERQKPRIQRPEALDPRLVLGSDEAAQAGGVGDRATDPPARVIRLEYAHRIGGCHRPGFKRPQQRRQPGRARALDNAAPGAPVAQQRRTSRADGRRALAPSPAARG